MRALVRMAGVAVAWIAVSAAAQPAATLYLDKDGTPVVRYPLEGPTRDGRFVDARPETHSLVRQAFWSYDKACFEIDARRIRRLKEGCGPAEVRLAWDEEPRDRIYPAVVRLRNGGALVMTQYLQPLADDGRLIDWKIEAPAGGVVAFRGEKSATSITLGERYFAQDGRGYAYLGPDEFTETPAGRALVDRGIPAAASGEILRVGPILLAELGRRLGRAPGERPSLFLTWLNRDGPQRDIQADVVPGAVIRFGMSGAWWGSGHEHTAPQLRRLMAHELVHFWNGEVFRPVSWSASWVSEGNAELLSVAALLAVGEMSAEQAAQQVAAAFNDCGFIARGRSWTDLHHYEKHGGRAPYVCGLAFQFAAVAIAARAEEGVDAFEFWKRVWAEHPRYFEAVLQAYFQRTGQPDVAEAFFGLFTDKATPVAEALRSMLETGGIEIVAPTTPGAAAALRGPFMTALMSADCQGNYSFNTLEDRFVVVQGSEILCKTFRKGQAYRVVEGMRFFEDTAAGIARANAACKAAGVVTMQAEDGTQVSVPCPPVPFADEQSLVQLRPDAVRRVLVKMKKPAEAGS